MEFGACRCGCKPEEGPVLAPVEMIVVAYDHLAAWAEHRREKVGHVVLEQLASDPAWAQAREPTIPWADGQKDPPHGHHT